MSLTGFETPTPETLLARARDAYASRLPAGNLALRRGVLPVLPHVDAELAQGLHGHLDWIAGQAMPLFASGANLDAWGLAFGVPRKPASPATGSVTFAASSASAMLSAGTTLRRADGGLVTVTRGAVVAAGQLTAAIAADAPGQAGNLPAASPLFLLSPVSGLPMAGSGGLTGGADREPDGAPGVAEAYRGRLLDRLRNPPQGGSAADYRRWALEVPGVTRAWVFAGEMGPGTVTLRFAMDNVYQDGVPQAADVAAVAAWLEPLRPLAADLHVVAPAPAPLACTIAGLDPDLPEVRRAIVTAIAGLLLLEAAPGRTLLLSHLREAVSLAAGEYDHLLVTPTGNITFASHQLPVMGPVTWTV